MRAGPAADYIVVGAGSAGAIIAARLAEDPACRVLLLEAGPRDASLLLRVPAAMRHAYNAPRFNWNYQTEPEPYLDHRRLPQPRGRVLGGSSSINGQLYLRGHPLDYEGWVEAGARGWSHAELLPYFRRLEAHAGAASPYRGADGPVRVATTPPDRLARAFLEAGRQAGYRASDDVNGFQQDGFGLQPKNIADGRRQSTAACYLRRPPANLRIRTGCEVTRIRFADGRAAGVEYRRRGEGRRWLASAGREVILAAGAINSPLLLLRSGIGPAAELRALGIGVVRDAGGVGDNLMDHPLTSVQLCCRTPITLHRRLGPLSLLGAAVQWGLSRRGLLANNHFDVVAFLRSRAGIRFPDLQLGLVPVAVAEGRADFLRQHAFQLQLSLQRPRSRGRVWLDRAGLRLRLNLLADGEDVATLRTGLCLARELLRQPALARHAGPELSPGDERQTDAELDAWLRATCHSSFHPCGTCRMGEDPAAVVDSACRVRGVRGLRVADASIMPRIPSANLNAPSMMIGEKAADLIAGRDPPPPSDLPVFVDPNWETAQR